METLHRPGRLVGCDARSRGNRLLRIVAGVPVISDRLPHVEHGQLRAYMAELALTDERNRGGDSKEDAKDEFFDD
ncbi:hypothetical protein [uncultured Sphingomonas sp.]|uniref:hypothetical protein n=1 Tax=uncultured Sphingomonas sp. TaxID=158754 RepID=UPI0035CC70E5